VSHIATTSRNEISSNNSIDNGHKIKLLPYPIQAVGLPPLTTAMKWGIEFSNTLFCLGLLHRMLKSAQIASAVAGADYKHPIQVDKAHEQQEHRTFLNTNQTTDKTEWVLTSPCNRTTFCASSATFAGNDSRIATCAATSVCQIRFRI
jgi:hypothetical protein